MQITFINANSIEEIELKFQLIKIFSQNLKVLKFDIYNGKNPTKAAVLGYEGNIEAEKIQQLYEITRNKRKEYWKDSQTQKDQKDGIFAMPDFYADALKEMGVEQKLQDFDWN